MPEPRSGKNRLHLHLHLDVRGHVTIADPEGKEFCLLR